MKTKTESLIIIFTTAGMLIFFAGMMCGKYFGESTVIKQAVDVGYMEMSVDPHYDYVWKSRENIVKEYMANFASDKMVDVAEW